MGYVLLAELKQSLELQGETYVDDDLRLAIESASEVVDSICGRSFIVPFGTEGATGAESEDDPDTTREYATVRSQSISIDDLAELTSVASDQVGKGEFTDWVPTDFSLEPLNAIADSRPWTVIRLTRYGTQNLCSDVTRVRVTGKFGWPEVPNNVKLATSILASRLLKRVREAPFGIAGMGPDGMAVRVSNTDPDVRMLLQPYVKPTRLA